MDVTVISETLRRTIIKQLSWDIKSHKMNNTSNKIEILNIKPLIEDY